MATIADYINIAWAVYHPDIDLMPIGHTVPGWSCKIWEEGTFFSNGFQGGVYQNEREVVCGFKGTDLSLAGGTGFGDLTADIRIGLGIIPNQADSAYAMCRSAAQIAEGRPLSVVGHSLGGGLAQVIGVWCNLPFVSFNSPGMRTHMKQARRSAWKPFHSRTKSSRSSDEIQGWNFRIQDDLVSAFGEHVGLPVDFPAAGGPAVAHKAHTCHRAVMSSNYASMDAGWYF